MDFLECLKSKEKGIPGESCIQLRQIPEESAGEIVGGVQVVSVR